MGPRIGCPSRGTPNQLMVSNNQVALVNPQIIPSPEEAVNKYEEAGGHITHFSGFGLDPLANDYSLFYCREIEFHQRYPEFDPFFHKLVNGDDTVFSRRSFILHSVKLNQYNSQ